MAGARGNRFTAHARASCRRRVSEPCLWQLHCALSLARQEPIAISCCSETAAPTFVTSAPARIYSSKHEATRRQSAGPSGSHGSKHTRCRREMRCLPVEVRANAAGTAPVAAHSRQQCVSGRLVGPRAHSGSVCSADSHLLLPLQAGAATESGESGKQRSMRHARRASTWRPPSGTWRAPAQQMGWRRRPRTATT